MNLNDEEVSRLIQNLFRFNHYLRRRDQAGGLRPGEVAILRCLLHNAQEGRPELKPSQISAILGLQQPSITPSLHSLEARGYVQRRGGEQDRREVYFSATEKTIALSVEERRRSAERIAARLTPYGRAKRPKLQGLGDAELVEFMRRNIAEREPYYAQAALVLDCDTLSDEEAVERIIHYLEGNE